MFLGTVANPGAGNTKLECYFPSGSGSPNCDVSLVDGYSVSVQCTLPGAATIGLANNLFSTGKCPVAITNGFCKNTQGYSSSINDVDAFFQQAKSTCYIWQLDGLDPTFSGPSTIKCTVSGGAPSSSKEKREEDEIALIDRDINDAGIAGIVSVERRHRHKARAHSRGLREVLLSPKL